MLQFILRPLLFTVIVLTVAIAAIRINYQINEPFEPTEVFRASACALPCWMELEVGVSELDDVEDFLKTQRHERYNYPNTGTRFNVLRQDRRVLASLDVDDNAQLIGLILRSDVCPVRLLYDLGVPDSIVKDHRGPLLLHYAEGYRLWFFPWSGASTLDIYADRDGIVLDNLTQRPRYDYTWAQTLNRLKRSCSART